ncbi:hypothetical protein Avbf_12797, partial [Armadillidium vulgare]
LITFIIFNSFLNSISVFEIMPRKYLKILLKILTLWHLIGAVTFVEGKERRQITFNPYTSMRLDFLWQAQISLMIPTLANIYAEKELPNPQNSQKPEELYIDPAYEKQLQKVMTFFSLLKVLLNRGPITEDESSLMYRFMIAVQNGALVTRHDDCGKIYKHCGKSAYKLINMSVIKVWQYVSEELNVKFKVTEKKSRSF